MEKHALFKDRKMFNDRLLAMTMRMMDDLSTFAAVGVCDRTGHREMIVSRFVNVNRFYVDMAQAKLNAET